MRTILINIESSVRLTELAQGSKALVQDVIDSHPDDTIARRLRDYGFVQGEPVRLVGRGPIGADPLLVELGYTRFALRRSEAERVVVEVAP
jgi:ferrous iron transport protein A